MQLLVDSLGGSLVPRKSLGCIEQWEPHSITDVCMGAG